MKELSEMIIKDPDRESLVRENKVAEQKLQEFENKLSKIKIYGSIINDLLNYDFELTSFENLCIYLVESIKSNIVHMDSVCIYMTEEDNAVLKASFGFDNLEINKYNSIPKNKNKIWSTINKSEPILSNDIKKEKSIDNFLVDNGSESLLISPIISDNNTSGCILAASYDLDAFDDEDLNFFQSISFLLSNYLSYSNKTNQLNKIKLEVEENKSLLSLKNTHHHAFSRISQRIHKSVSVKEVFENTVKSVQRYIKSADSVVIFMVENKQAVVKAFQGRPNWFYENVTKLPYPRTSIWKVITEGKSLLGYDIEENPFIESKDSEFGFQSYISVPILQDREPVGVISIISFEKDVISEEDLSILELVAKEIEIAMQHAKQSETLRINVEDLKINLYERTKILTETNRKMRTEIKERKKAENKIIASLKEKDILLTEVHHRVKNNLQMIMSLLNLQSKKIKDESALKMFNESKSRIKSIALLHEQLYRSKNMEKVDFGKYLKDLLKQMYRSYNDGTKSISYSVHTTGILLDINKAIPCGLIVNELVTNAFEHAFKESESGEVMIYFSKGKNSYSLTVNDNGCGMPKDVDLKNPKTLGLELVNSLVDQLDGSLKATTSKGTEFKIDFSD